MRRSKDALKVSFELIEAQEEIDRLRWKLLCLNRFCWEAPVKNDGFLWILPN